MTHPMTTHVEVWPVSADGAGLWLVSGADAWRGRLPVPADNGPHAEVELLLDQHSALTSAVLMHSTSWRARPNSLLLTYVAVIRCPGLVRQSWPHARPIGDSHLAPAGTREPAPTGGPEPMKPPTPRPEDVLQHALRHLSFLLETDPTNAAALDRYWRQHLANLRPALATMYGPTEQAQAGHAQSHAS